MIDFLINQAHTGNWNIKVTISTHVYITLHNFVIGFLDLKFETTCQNTSFF